MRNFFGISLFVVCMGLFVTCAQKLIISHKLITNQVKQFEKAEFDIELSVPFVNPYDAREIAMDMEIASPSGKKLVLPCYYESKNGDISLWKARFTPQESGQYSYVFKVTKGEKSESESEQKTFAVIATSGDGFLHTHNNFWTLKFDSGKPFRGIGENVGWESRSFEDPKWTYDYLLPTLSQNGANFFRTWMCVWNLPVAWNKVNDTNRYVNSSEYFNEHGIKRMDELVQMCDSLGLYFMLSIDAHGALIPGAYWEFNSHNKANGGPAATPTEFFTNEESRSMYKNRLRYLVARWGYSPSVAAWEFFNEIDNAVFTATPQDSVLIDHKIITGWHNEMSTYLKKIDPYQHIVTTSISHREIKGMNDVKNIDLNQKHIYNKTGILSSAIHENVKRYNKPYVIGEFGYDWNWDNVKPEHGPGFDFDYKRGLWYGLFSPTPIVPMTWWWEFFDDRKMTPYFASVREISDQMLAAGNGSFENTDVSAPGLEVYATKCGEVYFVYVLNNSKESITSSLNIENVKGKTLDVKTFNPMDRVYQSLPVKPTLSGGINLSKLESQEEVILILKPTASAAASGR